MKKTARRPAAFDAVPILRGLLDIGPNQLHAQVVAREMLASFANGLSMHPDWSNDAEFRSFLVLASATLGLSQKDLAYQLMVSQMTLQRWLKGESLPLPMARKGIVAALIELAYAMIDSIALNGDSATSPDTDNLDTDADCGMCEIGVVADVESTLQLEH